MGRRNCGCVWWRPILQARRSRFSRPCSSSCYTRRMAQGGKKDVRHATLYRAYRPQTWEEAERGQPQIVALLKAALKHPEKMAHAYLFAGSRGTGKTSVARILARALNVSYRDLYEIDAASNRGIDEIRLLREAVYAMPFESPYKFYIIDEEHQLTPQAWAALLKTLEEPPKPAMFVLATTERDKVPATIHSRSQVHIFKQPTREILAEIAIDVAKREGYSLERAGAELVALLAEGSFRDALSILQKALSSVDPEPLGHGAGGKEVSATDVEKVTGAPRGEIVRKLLTALADSNADEALAA